MPCARRPHPSVLPLALAGSCGLAHAQPPSHSFYPLSSGTSQPVFALAVFDEDGPGPLPPALFAGGDLTSAGGVPVTGIARWDGHEWSAVGDTPPLNVRALLVHDDGSGGGPGLVVSGVRTSGTGHNVFLWRDAAWSNLGQFDQGAGQGLALTHYSEGATNWLCIGGSFTGFGIYTPNVARSDVGANWTALGNGLDNTVLALSPFEVGGQTLLVAGGRFTHSGSTRANYIAAWNGTAWRPATGGDLNNEVRCLCVFDDGGGGGPMLYAGGPFTIAGGVVANRVARWNGTAWSALGLGVNGEVNAMAVFDDGGGGGPQLYVAGDFSLAGGQPALNIARWNGAAWSPANLAPILPAGGVLPDLRVLCPTDSSLFIGGGFEIPACPGIRNIAEWKPTCYANCDCSGIAPALNVADFTCFLQKFAAADPYANCDQSTTPPLLNVADFTCFLQGFAEGCP